MSHPCASENSPVNILKEGEIPQEQKVSELQEDIRKYLRLIPQVAEPSLGRVREIQEEIKKGTYLNREMIEETAARMAIRFLQKE